MRQEKADTCASNSARKSLSSSCLTQPSLFLPEFAYHLERLVGDRLIDARRPALVEQSSEVDRLTVDHVDAPARAVEVALQLPHQVLGEQAVDEHRQHGHA